MAHEPVEINFQGTDGAIRFASPDMAKAFRRVVHSWPSTEGPGPSGPFADVRPARSKWSIDILRPEPRQKKYDTVNGICDLVVELNWSRLRQNNELMCLHAAGIQMGQSLVVFPSRRRAGKSTLTAELARRGHRVFTDDILALHLDSEGVSQGLATGISPRLRLPLPLEASGRFSDWVCSDTGPSNRQYKYLTDAPTAAFGTSCPVGAIVTLDRVDEDVGPAFSKMEIGRVLPVLIHQNFGRFVHSGRTLAAFEAIARDLPCLKLTYGSFEIAADFLDDAVKNGLLKGGAVTNIGHGAVPAFDRAIEPFNPTRTYQQRVGFQYVTTGDEAYISDANGVGIFRMGSGMLPIWRLLEEPMNSDEIVETLCEVFPEVDTKVLVKDVAAALQQLNDAGLITTAQDWRK